MKHLKLVHIPKSKLPRKKLAGGILALLSGLAFAPIIAVATSGAKAPFSAEDFLVSENNDPSAAVTDSLVTDSLAADSFASDALATDYPVPAATENPMLPDDSTALPLDEQQAAPADANPEPQPEEFEGFTALAMNDIGSSNALSSDSDARIFGVLGGGGVTASSSAGGSGGSSRPHIGKSQSNSSPNLVGDTGPASSDSNGADTSGTPTSPSAMAEETPTASEDDTPEVPPVLLTTSENEPGENYPASDPAWSEPSAETPSNTKPVSVPEPGGLAVMIAGLLGVAIAKHFA